MDIKKQSPIWKCAFCTTHGRGLPLKLLKLAREGWKVKNYKKYILGRTTERERNNNFFARQLLMSKVENEVQSVRPFVRSIN